MDENPNVSGLSALAWGWWKRKYSQSNLSIEWEKIKNVNNFKYGLIVVGFLGYGKIIIPKFLEDFDEVKKIIYNYRQSSITDNK